MKLLMIVSCLLCTEVRFYNCKPHERLALQLLKLDEIISSSLAIPSPIDKKTLIKNLVFYARALTELTERVNEQNEDYRVGAKLMFKKDKPVFLTIKYDKYDLVKKLEWTMVDYNNFLFIKREAVTAYKEFTRAYKMNIVWFL